VNGPAVRLLAVFASAVLLASACSDSPVPDDSPPDSAAEQAGGFNDADTTWMQGMIPHHMQAVRMAEMVPDRTASPELADLARRMVESQSSEVELMRSLLADAGADAPGPGGGMPGAGRGHGGAGHGGGQGMGGRDSAGGGHEGMLGPGEMRELMTSEGRDFDLRWTEQMIRHHEGAIASSERLLDDGASPEVADLARDIIAEQRSEIEQMQAWRDEWQS
jgi:uncharacterized protein (DUF305 family)